MLYSFVEERALRQGKIAKYARVTEYYVVGFGV
jgi:hypothetical protein